MGTEPGGRKLDALVDELARVLHEPDEARELARRAGFPVADLPAFDTASVFWSRVIRAADDGKTVGGVGAIVAQAKARFPGNRFFAAHGSTTTATAAESMPPEPRLGAAIDNRSASIGQQIVVHGHASFGAMTVSVPASAGPSQGELRDGPSSREARGGVERSRAATGEPSRLLDEGPTPSRIGAPPPSDMVDDSEYDVFLSYNSKSVEEVAALATRLHDDHGLRVFFDRWELVPGDPVILALERAIDRSQVVAVFMGPDGVGPWQELERQAALHHAVQTGRRVIPALLRGASPQGMPGFLRTRGWVELETPEGFARLVAGILGQAPGEVLGRSRTSQGGRETPPSRRNGEVERSHAATDKPSRLPDDVSPNPVADRLQDAYARREALVVAGRPTADVDAEILELRRALRRGPTLHAGEFLGDGRFRLLEVIGRGGFGLVWKAYDTKERRLVAVKVLHGELAREASRRERLFRGAKRMAELRHPNVVRVLQSEGEEEGFHYFVMELVGGGDLHRAVVEREIDVERALTVIETIADALAAAHACGLVHRDVKPENILLREDGSPALGDFDLVQARDTTGGTRTGAMGSMIYAAPEQGTDASRVDHRADVYGLGMTTVFCVHGNKLPMTAMFNRDVFMRGLECAPEVRAVLQRAVALEPETRFESMTSFRDALAAARRAGGGGYSRVEVVAPRREEAEADARVVAPHEREHGAEPSTKVVHGVELVLVPGGRFLMGSPEGEDGRFDREGPQHWVELKSFWLARTPVTNAQYREYLEADPEARKPMFWADQNYNQPQQPVVGVSWYEAQAYCAWAGLQLPTEAQWEYACRAGTMTRYCSGDNEENLKRVGWYSGNSGGRLHAVGELEPNAWGLYDMHGNVWEWCEDTWVGHYERAAHRAGDGGWTLPSGGANQVVRGGVFDDVAHYTRSASRNAWNRVDRSLLVGFRPAQGHP